MTTSTMNAIPVCASCKRPLVRTSEQFWTCDAGHRGLILAGTVDAAVASASANARRDPESSRRKEITVEV